MKVRELIERLQQAPMDATVVVPASDHSYRDRFSVDIITALYDRAAGWTEDYGEDTTPEADYGKRLAIVSIGG